MTHLKARAELQESDTPGRLAGGQRLQSLTAALAAVALIAAVGCESSPRTNASLTTRGPERNPAVEPDPALAARLEQHYVVGPAAARDLNYRIDWQYPNAGQNVRILTVQGDSVYTLDNRNFLTRVRTADGSLMWRVAAVDIIEEVTGVTVLNNHVYLTTGSNVIVLDAGNGTQVGKQALGKIANTAPVVYGDYLIYGSRNGQLVWHSYPVSFMWRSYQVSHSIQVPPIIKDNVIVTIGTDGREATVMAVDASSASQFWSRRLLNTVTCPPVIGDGVVYVASLDQHLYAIDLATNRYLWKVLTESPLTESPVLIGDRLYQQIPSQGLTCFAALPIDKPGGEQIWVSGGTKGSVIMEQRGNLFVWDAPTKTLSIVEAARGSVVRSMTLPQVHRLLAADENNRELYAISTDGRLIHLVPRT